MFRFSPKKQHLIWFVVPSLSLTCACLLNFLTLKEVIGIIRFYSFLLNSPFAPVLVNAFKRAPVMREIGLVALRAQVIIWAFLAVPAKSNNRLPSAPITGGEEMPFTWYTRSKVRKGKTIYFIFSLKFLRMVRNKYIAKNSEPKCRLFFSS